MLADGFAFLDRAGNLAAADDGFKGLLGLPPEGAGEELLAESRAYPELARFLAGEGPDELLLPRPEAPCLMARRRCDTGTVLVACLLHEWGTPAELALQGMALTRLEGGFAHDLKNPLNAMALQLALLGDKIASASENLAAACGGNLSSLRKQIGRIDDLVRRHAEAADPAARPGVDVPTLLAELEALFGHESRRRRIAFEVEPPPAARVRGEAARVTRLVLGLAARAFAATGEGGRVQLGATATATSVTFRFAHAPDGAGEPKWPLAAARMSACALEGELRTAAEDGLEKIELALSRERAQ